MTMEIIEAQQVYSELPSLVQPHTLDKETLEACGSVLLAGERAGQQLDAISCMIDYAHCLSETELPMARAVLANAAVRSDNLRHHIETRYKDRESFRQRTHEANELVAHAPYYLGGGGLPHDDADNTTFQPKAYERVQREVLNPLLGNQARRGQHNKVDVITLANTKGRTLAAQTLNRLLVRHPDIGFVVLPANQRESHRNGPESGPLTREKHATFCGKIVLCDHTFIPFNVSVNPRTYSHPQIAEVIWRDFDLKGHDLTGLCLAMRSEVSGAAMQDRNKLLLCKTTAHVLKAVAKVEPVGESVYPERHPRTVQAGRARRWLTGQVERYEELSHYYAGKLS